MPKCGQITDPPHWGRECPFKGKGKDKGKGFGNASRGVNDQQWAGRSSGPPGMSPGPLAVVVLEYALGMSAVGSGPLAVAALA